MTESTCKMIMEMSSLFRTIMLASCFIGLWKNLIEPKLQRRNVLLYVGIAVYLLVLDAMEIPPYVRYLPIFIVCIAYGYIFKICKWEKPVFLLLFLYNLHTMSFLIANSIYQVISGCMTERLDMSSPDAVEKIYLQTGILSILFLILYAAILIMLYMIFIKMHLEISNMSATEFVFLSVLNIAGIILSYMIVKLSVVPLGNEVFILYDEASDFLWKVPVIAILLIVGEYSSIFIFCRYKQYLSERESIISRELGLKQLENRLEEAQTLYGSLKSLRHDIKNHMQTIQGLISSGEMQATTTYMERLNETIEEIDGKFSTGNTLCDVILNDKYRIAKKDNIKMSVDFRYDKGISDFDLGIILSNLCDNAIEACRKVQKEERRIDISYMGAGPCVLLTVGNSYDGKDVILGEDGLPLSSKHPLSEMNFQTNHHGIGLKNVSVIAESYFGNVQIDAKENEFLVSVMLQKREDVSPIVT